MSVALISLTGARNSGGDALILWVGARNSGGDSLISRGYAGILIHLDYSAGLNAGSTTHYETFSFINFHFQTSFAYSDRF